MVMLAFTNCGKKNSGPGGDDQPPPTQEKGIEVTLDGVAENQYTAAPGETYPFKVNITSELPQSGVSITVTAVTDPGGISIPQDEIPSPVTASTTINLKGLEPIRTVKVTVTIKSLANPNNVTIKTFWITNKSDE